MTTSIRSPTAPDSNAPPRTRELLPWVLACAAFVLLLLGVAMVAVEGATRHGHARALLTADGPVVGPDRPAETFKRHALNALLVPLLDDAEPARWTDVALRYQCGPLTHVDVDGRPMVPGTPVPATAFSVRWHIDQCWPFEGASVELSGVVELTVFHEDLGLTAIVSAASLDVSTASGMVRFDAPFAAALKLAAGEARPAR